MVRSTLSDWFAGGRGNEDVLRSLSEVERFEQRVIDIGRPWGAALDAGLLICRTFAARFRR